MLHVLLRMRTPLTLLILAIGVTAQAQSQSISPRPVGVHALDGTIVSGRLNQIMYGDDSRLVIQSGRKGSRHVASLGMQVRVPGLRVEDDIDRLTSSIEARASRPVDLVLSVYSFDQGRYVPIGSMQARSEDRIQSLNGRNLDSQFSRGDMVWLRLSAESTSPLRLEVDEVKFSGSKSWAYKFMSVPGTVPAGHYELDSQRALQTYWTLAGAGAAPNTIDWSRHKILIVALGERPTSGFSVEFLGFPRTGPGMTRSLQYRERRPNPYGIILPIITYPSLGVVVKRGPTRFDPGW